MPPSETCAGTTPEDEYANMLLQPLRVEIRTARLALKYYHILHKVAKLEPVRMPSNPQYICAFIASEKSVYLYDHVLCIVDKCPLSQLSKWQCTSIPSH